MTLFGIFAKLFGRRAHTVNSSGYFWLGKYYVTKGEARTGEVIWME